jgi:hypothetical protein
MSQKEIIDNISTDINKLKEKIKSKHPSKKSSKN